MSNFLTIKQVCEQYGVTRKTVYNWRSQKKVESKAENGFTLIKESDVALLAQPKARVNDSDLTHTLLIEIQRLHSRIDDLERVITQGKLRCDSSPKSVKRSVTTQKSTHHAYNDDRKQEVISKAAKAYTALGRPGDITVTALAREAGLDRRTVKKYWSEILELA